MWKYENEETALLRQEAISVISHISTFTTFLHYSILKLFTGLAIAALTD